MSSTRITELQGQLQRDIKKAESQMNNRLFEENLQQVLNQINSYASSISNVNSSNFNHVVNTSNDNRSVGGITLNTNAATSGQLVNAIMKVLNQEWGR